MATYRSYTAAFKQQVLTQYQPNTPGWGFKALAKKNHIPRDTTIQSWYRQWDGTPASLQRNIGSGRKRTLTQAESHALILDPVHKALKKKQKIDYADIHSEIIAKPDYRHVSLAMVKRVGRKEHRLTWKRTEESLGVEGICNHAHSRFGLPFCASHVRGTVHMRVCIFVCVKR